MDGALAYNINCMTRTGPGPGTSDLRAAVISALFGNAEQGALYDPSDLTTLFQDSAGTTPVTADGQPVGRMEDLSGNGNHSIQATAAARPLYRTDGTLHWLEFDGVDDTLISAPIDLSSISTFSAMLGIRKLTDNLRTLMNFGISANSAGGNIEVLQSGWSPASNRYGAAYNDTIIKRFTTTDTTFGPERSDVIAWRFNLLGPTQSDNARLRVNGSAVALNASDAASTSGDLSNSPLRIGSRAGGSIFYDGLFYGGAFTGSNITDQQSTTAEAWLAEKSGVTL